MVTQIKMIVILVVCICLSGCGIYDNKEDNSNEIPINMESYAIDDNKAYVYIEEMEEGNYSMYIHKNMGDIEYAYYTVNVYDREGNYNIDIVKKNALNEDQCSNILSEVVILKEYPKMLEISFNKKRIEYVIIDPYDTSHMVKSD